MSYFIASQRAVENRQLTTNLPQIETLIHPLSVRPLTWLQFAPTFGKCSIPWHTDVGCWMLDAKCWMLMPMLTFRGCQTLTLPLRQLKLMDEPLLVLILLSV